MAVAVVREGGVVVVRGVEVDSVVAVGGHCDSLFGFMGW